MALTLDGLSHMSADQLRSAVAEIDVQLTDLHIDNDGAMRNLEGPEREEFDALLRLRDRAAQHLKLRESVGRGRGMERAFGGTLTRTGVGADDMRAVLDASDRQVRDQALRQLDGYARMLQPEQGDRLDRWVRSTVTAENPHMDGAAFARRMLISESDAYRSAFVQLMRGGPVVLSREEAEAVRALQRLEAAESRAMGEGSGAVGAFGLPVLIDPSIMLSSGAGAAPIMENCRVVPTNTSIWKGVSSAPPTFSWDAEASEVSDDSPTLAQPSIPIYTTRGWIPYSIEVGMDYPQFADEMAALLEQGYLDIMATATATGTGSSQPTGVFTKLDATTTSEVTLTTAGSLGAVDIFKIWNAVPERFRYRAKWIMSVSVESQIRSFSSANQSSSYFTTDLTADGLTRLNGRPVVVTDYAPTLVSGTSHQNQLIVGDLSGYVVARRIGLQIEPIQQLFGNTTGTPTGQRGFFAYARAGADVTVPNALRILNQT